MIPEYEYQTGNRNINKLRVNFAIENLSVLIKKEEFLFRGQCTGHVLITKYMVLEEFLTMSFISVTIFFSRLHLGGA